MATLQTIFSFPTDPNAGAPGGLVSDAAGNLYGTTTSIGSNNYGTVYTLTRDATSATGYASAPTVLVSFNGVRLGSDLYSDTAGNLFGTTAYLGPSTPATVFEIARDATSPTGYASTSTTLASFGGNSHPAGGLIADAAGNLFGVTSNGGPSNDGTVFKIARDATNPTGYASTPTTLASFNGVNVVNGINVGNGGNPEGSLVADNAGNLYGLTHYGGDGFSGNFHNYKTLFKIAHDPASATGYASTPQVVVTFDFGSQPNKVLLADSTKNLYATSPGFVGDRNFGSILKLSPDATSSTGYGTLQEIARINSYSTYGFGTNPENLAIDGAGNLFATTNGNSYVGKGIVLKLAPDATSRTGYGDFVRLASFKTSDNGAYPASRLLVGSDNTLYGTTSLNIQGSPGGTIFRVTGTDTPEVCYVTGTLIRTHRGEVAVETLTVGDRVLTLDGAWKPIRWIGHRHVRCDRHPAPTKVHPVRVAAGTFGEDLPSADLWLSPGHALCLDGCLVPVRALVDGARIVQVAQDQVTYWHVELDGHDVILANGLPAESYLDTGNRRSFDDVPASLLHFDEDPAPGYDGAGYCLPVVESGPRLSAIRARYGLGGVPAADGASGEAAAYFVADGMVLAPCLSGENDLRVLVPAGVTELRLVSPHGVAGSGDVRRLGVIVSAVSVGDGMSSRQIALDAAGLYAGFHDVERDGERAWRWTDGEAHLAPSLLWPDLAGPVLLHMQGVFTGLRPAGNAEASAGIGGLAEVDAGEAASPPDAERGTAPAGAGLLRFPVLHRLARLVTPARQTGRSRAARRGRSA